MGLGLGALRDPLAGVGEEGLLRLAHVPVQAPRERVKQVDRGVLPADGGHRPGGRVDVDGLPLLELRAASAVRGDPGRLPALGRVVDVELGGVGEEERAEGEGVRADGGDHDPGHRGVDDGPTSRQLGKKIEKKETRE